MSKPGKTFNCAPFREFDPKRNTTEKPSEANCCSRPKTCGDFLPVSKPGMPFPCGNFSEYNPGMSDAWPPSEQICCKVSFSGFGCVCAARQVFRGGGCREHRQACF